MNIMKKKPELLKKSGKSNQTLRNFLNNLKENDLHYENKQITQCVFLGVLRLKPVPSIFSNNVPSISSTAESDTSNSVKNNNSNKELDKNTSKKNNINKVLTGKIAKKNPEKVKAAVKKVPIKKSNIKIKLNPKKKVVDAGPSTSNEKQEIIFSDTSKTVSPDSVIARTTLKLNPVISPTKFNPVQNLFDKLKQRVDDSQNEPGPSKITLSSNRASEDLKSSAVTKYKVCKINANGQNSLIDNGCKKLKKSLHKKSYERLSIPSTSTSPITISDTESTSKKDRDDVIILDETNSSNSQSSSKDRIIIVEDVIVINDDSRPKRMSPRNKTIVLEEDISNQVINKQTQTNREGTTVNENLQQFVSANHEEVIVISDEPKQIDKSKDNITCSEHHGDQITNDIIVIDEVKEVRVSPRLKKMEEKAKEITANKKIIVDEVIILTEDEKISNKVPEIVQNDSINKSITQELNINIDNQQTEEKQETTSPRLLKLVGANEKISVTVKRELIESEVVIINEKPKRRKNRLRSPTLLPPMLLNAPMLLRSELAPKKPNYLNDNSRIRRTRDKMKTSISKSSTLKKISQANSKVSQLEEVVLEPDEQCFNPPDIQVAATIIQTDHKPPDSPPLLDEEICLSGTSDDRAVKKLHLIQHKDEDNLEKGAVQETLSVPQQAQKENPQTSYPKLQDPDDAKDDIIQEKILLSPKTKTKEARTQKIKMFNKKPNSVPTTQKSEAEIMVKEENNCKEKVSPRLLRSDLLKQKKLTEVKSIEAENIQSPDIQKIESDENESINLIIESDPKTQVFPRILRSSLVKKSLPSQNSTTDDVIVVKNEGSEQNEEKRSDAAKSKQKSKKKSIQKSEKIDLDEIIIVSDRRVKKRRGRPPKLSRLIGKESSSVKSELEEVVVLIHDEPKQKQVPPILLLLNPKEVSSSGTESVIVVPEQQNNQVEIKSPRSLRSDRVRKTPEVIFPKMKSPVKVENNSLSIPSFDQQQDVVELQVVSQGNSELPLKGKPKIIKLERENSSHRLLRSETRKELSESMNVDNTNKVTSRLLRSEVSSQRNSRNVVKELSPHRKGTGRSPQKSPQSNGGDAKSFRGDPSKVVIIQNEFIENRPPALAASEGANVIQVPEIQKQPVVPDSTQPVVIQRKRGRPRKSDSMKSPEPKVKTCMLLRSELAQLKNTASDVKQNGKEFSQKKSKSKVNNILITDQLLESSNSPLELQNSPENKRVLKPIVVQTVDTNRESNVIDSKKNTRNSIFVQCKDTDAAVINSTDTKVQNINEVELTSEIVCLEVPAIQHKNDNLRRNSPRRNKSPNVTNKDIVEPSPEVNVVTTDIVCLEVPAILQKNDNSRRNKSLDVTNNDIVEPSAEVNVVTTEIACLEVPTIYQQNDNSRRNSPRRNKSTNVANKDIVEPSKEVNVVATEIIATKTKSSGRRKKSSKRNRKVKIEEEQNTSEETTNNHSMQSQEVQEEDQTLNVTAKKPDIAIFDFDESEPETLPLRLNTTPRKEKPGILTHTQSPKSTPTKKDIPPKSKKPKLADEPITKAQAKVKLLTVFDENSTRKNDPHTNSDKKKTKTTSTEKSETKQSSTCPQNEKVKGKRGRKKKSPNKTDTPQSKATQETSRSSTSPLKQTTITDMFNMIMKKEKAAVDSVFQSTPKETPLGKAVVEKGNENIKSVMPPPRPNKKPLPNNDEDEDEPYNDDSDCDSRMEWIPEEYAEYKFKYSARKMMTYKPIHKCKICLLILPTYYKLSKHKEEHSKKENPYICKQCEKTFSNVEDLTAHLRIHKGKHPYTCKKCDAGFWSKKSLDAHTPIHVLRKMKQPNKRFRCDVCAKEFSKLCDMERHTRVHTGEKPCICNICNKRFQQSHNLSKHLLTHLHVKPFHCEICNKQFGRNDVLNRHLLIHSVDKPIKCPLCSKGFIRQSQLNNHMKKNHLDAAKIGANVDSKVAEVE